MMGRAGCNYLICFLAAQYQRLTLKNDRHSWEALAVLLGGSFICRLVFQLFSCCIYLRYYHCSEVCISRDVYPCLKIENNTYTITKVNLSIFVYRLFHENFSPIVGTNLICSNDWREIFIK